MVGTETPNCLKPKRNSAGPPGWEIQEWMWLWEGSGRKRFCLGQVPFPGQVVRVSSVDQSCPTVCDPMDCSMPGFPVHHQLPELAQTHVHQSRWCHPTISSSVVPFSSCLQSFPASESFPVSQFFASGGQSIGVSASGSVLLMGILDWFPLVLTGWISLQSKGFMGKSNWLVWIVCPPLGCEAWMEHSDWQPIQPHGGGEWAVSQRMDVERIVHIHYRGLHVRRPQRSSTATSYPGNVGIQMWFGILQWWILWGFQFCFWTVPCRKLSLKLTYHLGIFH